MKYNIWVQYIEIFTKCIQKYDYKQYIVLQGDSYEHFRKPIAHQ